MAFPICAAAIAFSAAALAQTPAAPPTPPGAQPPAFPGAPGTPGGAAAAARAATVAAQPWMDASLPPDRRADLVESAMTLDEKIGLVHGYGAAIPASLGGAGFVLGIPRLSLPDLNMSDSSVGIARDAPRSRYATLMPATIGEAASWDPQIGYQYGALIGRELRAQGFNVSLAGGMDIMREPRNGRSFEYLAEDPVLTGEMYVGWIHGLQDQHVIGDIKHYAFNDQETGRTIGNVLLDEKSMRQSDLLAFQIGVTKGQPGMAMCSYNKVNGDWACENDFLLNRVLKQDWGFKGWVISDWGATHSLQKAALAGLDQEQPGSTFFGAPLAQAVRDGSVPQVRLDDMVHRILRTEFATGIVDRPITPQVVDVFGDLDVAQSVAEAASVLLKNDGTLPLTSGSGKKIAVIGSHADVGVLTGGGSAQVDPPGGNAVPDIAAAEGRRAPPIVWWPSSPLKAIRSKMPAGAVSFDSGTDPAVAAAAAAKADVAIVFVNQWTHEGADLPNLSLPDNQDALVEAVAAANPRTIVVLETGGPVTMPWIAKVAAVVEIWYPGARGAEATANLLFGDVNFTAKLPVTFPLRDGDLPVGAIAGSNLTPAPATPAAAIPPPSGLPPVALSPSGQAVAAPAAGASTNPRPPRPAPQPFDIAYPEKDEVGYKWYDARHVAPLFPFGFGLSYTNYSYAGLTVAASGVTFTVRNNGARDGAEIAQVYAQIPGEPFKRLVGWSKISLKTGESRAVTIPIDPLYLSIFDAVHGKWQLQKGSYAVFVGGSSRDTPLAGHFAVTASR
jgi:beta-glucosidase